MPIAKTTMIVPRMSVRMALRSVAGAVAGGEEVMLGNLGRGPGLIVLVGPAMILPFA
ncbi:hypothetical protein GCM10025795_28500 [Verticiella sediminum]